jgi:hypothetical protein
VIRFRAQGGLAQGLERTPELRTALRTAAEAVAENAEAAMEKPPAPVRVARQGRGVRVTNTSPSATLEEWGTASREPLAPLRRGVRSAGLRLDESQ